MDSNTNKPNSKDSTMQITANYSGYAPSLCFGEWTVGIDEYEFSGIKGDMRTAGTFESWAFTEDYDVKWEEYKSGYEFGDEWLDQKNPKLLVSTIEETIERQMTMAEKEELYNALAEHDFRYNSCGGCI